MVIRFINFGMIAALVVHKLYRIGSLLEIFVNGYHLGHIEKEYPMRLFITFLIVFLLISPVSGAGIGSVESEITSDVDHYNKGVELMLEKKFSSAEKWFRKALASREQFAEAHNNLAYVLRKQGADHFEESLKHYNRAIEIQPNLPQPYMYRGVLYVQMVKIDLAKKDHLKLKSLDASLAAELQYVIINGREKEPEQFFGVSRKLK
jgi:tetratricopeptide (TPR) repeat protein